MIYVYCPRKSDSARALVTWLKNEGYKAEKIKTKAYQYEPSPNEKDLLINWGSPAYPFKHGLNKIVSCNKLQQLAKLKAAGIPVPDVKLGAHPGEGWYARKHHHQEANDLLANLAVGDYYVKHVPTTHEYRVHSFQGKSIRVARKVPRIDNPHPIFRSWQAGWKMSYALQPDAPKALRPLAHAAVEALGWDFGAVDVAVKEGGGLVVWEVNSAPGLEGGTIPCYGKAILACQQ